MVALCPKCGKDCRNQPALKMHLPKCKVEKKAEKRAEKPLEDLELDIPEQETETKTETPESSIGPGKDEEEYGCSECQGKIDYGAHKCPHCGAELVWE